MAEHDYGTFGSATVQPPPTSTELPPPPPPPLSPPSSWLSSSGAATERGCSTTKATRTTSTKGVVFIDEDGSIDRDCVDENSRRTDVASLLRSFSADSNLTNATDANGTNGDGSSSTGKQQQPKIKVPKIYFGTRTHKQISQIIKELKRTAYKNVKMCVLGSREHSCVHPEVKTKKNKNEECKILLDGKKEQTCRYFLNVNRIRTQRCLETNGLRAPFDLEDLVKWGTQKKICPYYTMRTIKEQADIIFCPYNYLIDPVIRDVMGIDVEENVIVFDEAHNMEDSARSAASLSVAQHDFESAIADLDNLAQMGVLAKQHERLSQLLSGLSSWLEKQSHDASEYAGFNESSRIWNGLEFVGCLKYLGLGAEDYQEFRSLVSDVRQSAVDNDSKGDSSSSSSFFGGGNRRGSDEEKEPTVNSATLTLLTGLAVVFDFLYRENYKYSDDYRVVLTKSLEEASPRGKMMSGWVQAKKMKKTWVYSVNFSCLNPAVAFSDFTGKILSIILTSGTLSPMDSFESELGVQFKIKLEASHVITPSQVWIGAIGQGCGGLPLKASFQHTETYEFQDEIGRLVLTVCQKTPNGVLCFMTSYNMLDKLTRRWKETGLWPKLTEVKTIVSEPRGSDKENFQSAMNEFYGAVESTEESEDSITGALFFAVFRGKVSEGLDFADNNARAVITIGIPFPNVKDIQVDLKRKYNRQHCKSRNLLSGDRWYEIQAFRALNQALGRCIRHKNDWGALILIDERFAFGDKYVNGLSKWVRQCLKRYPSTSHALESLTQFMTVNEQKYGEDSCDGELDDAKLSELDTVPAEKVVPCQSVESWLIPAPVTGNPLVLHPPRSLSSSLSGSSVWKRRIDPPLPSI